MGVTANILFHVLDVDRSDLKREIIEAAQKAQYYSLQIRRLMESNRNGSTSYPPAASMFAGDDEHWGNGKFSDLSTINLGHDSAAIYLRAQSLIHQQTQGYDLSCLLSSN